MRRGVHKSGSVVSTLYLRIGLTWVVTAGFTMAACGIPVSKPRTTAKPAKLVLQKADVPNATKVLLPPFPGHPPAVACERAPRSMKCRAGGSMARKGVDASRCLVGSVQDPLQQDRGHIWVKTFYADVAPILEEDYARCHRAGVCPPKPTGAGFSDMAPRAPVQGLTAAEASTYCKGIGKRLLSKVEWQALGGCAGPKAVLRCGVGVKGVAALLKDDGLPYGRALALQASKDRQAFRLPTKRRRSRKARPVGCKRACRAGASWLTCDPVFADHFGRPPVETATGFVIDDTYKDNHRVEALLRGYHRKYPAVTDLRSVGTTHQGRTIWALRVTDNPKRDEDEPALLLNGAHHGDELLSVDYTLDALQQVLEHQDKPRIKRWISKFDLWFVPLVNPDGNYTTIHRACSPNTGRKNGRDLTGDGRFEIDEGVDLNRNYPFRWHYLGEVGSKSIPRHHHYRGEQPASEPEVQAMIKLANKYHFLGALTWHTNAKKILSPYTIRKVKNTRPDVPWLVAETMQRAMRAPKRYEFKVAKDLYPVDGVDQDWHFFTHGTLAYIIEGTHHNPQSMKVRALSVKVGRPIFGALLDRLLDGPGVYGTVRDAAGKPLQAEAMITQIKTYEGERWTSRAHDGRYDRVLPRRGRYTLRVRAPGYRTVNKKFRVGRERLRVDVVLTREIPAEQE
jgi:hypothetical protein